MSRFIESIRIENGRICLPDLHNERFNATRKLFFCVDQEWDLRSFIYLPDFAKKGVFKCRIEYDIEVLSVEFLPYQPKEVRTLKLVYSQLDYAFKSVDRKQLEDLQMLSAGKADEVLIVKDGFITDTSYSNILFRQNNEWFTPEKPLLEGVQREFLLQSGQASERAIRVDEIDTFDAFMLINALLPFDEKRVVPITKTTFV